MKLVTDDCKLPNPKFGGKFKWPSLTEAHQHFFGKDFPDKHTALGDVRALANIYWAKMSQAK